MKISVDAFLDVLPHIGLGMLGIFIVTGIIIAITAILNKLTEKKD